MFVYVVGRPRRPRRGRDQKNLFNIQIMSLKWVYGEPQEKTPLRSKAAVIPTPTPTPSTVPPPSDDNVCLQTINKNTCTELIKPKSKEELYDRINSRERIVQIGQNPFLHQSHSNSYVDDIVNQDRYLRSRSMYSAPVAMDT